MLGGSFRNLPVVSILQSQPLREALGNATKPVKWIRLNGEREQKIEPTHALLLVATGNYEGISRNGKVRAIREVDHRKARPWQQCWRTTEAAILPPDGEYFRKVSGIGGLVNPARPLRTAGERAFMERTQVHL